MEYLLNQKLTQELDRVKGISDKQHAFTKKRSCFNRPGDSNDVYGKDTTKRN